jgi:peptidoglycan/xylan/chitin deacetylase (PgdA/CDA1 family)
MKRIYEIIERDKVLWDNFTRAEEYSPKRLDGHQRFTYKVSNFKDISIPIVSSALSESGIRIQYPENKKFALCLTHDIDDIYPPISHTIYSSFCSLRRHDLKGFGDQFLWRTRGRESSPYINFKKIMDLEEKYNAKSSFYFIATDRDIRRFRYNIEDIGAELGTILDNGCEVGLHGGYYAFICLDEMKKEKRRLEKILGRKIIGYRNHYLRIRVPDTWELLAEAGFKYDTTLGYNDMVGFRNGLCHPFNPYNRNNNKYIDILELNLNIMDGTLFSSASTLEDAWNVTKHLIDITKKYNGVLTLLWHNSSFNCPFRKEMELFYEKILKYGKSQGAWMTSGKEICSWWHYSLQ